MIARGTLTIALVRAMVSAYDAVLTDEDRRLIARHFAEVDQLLLVVVGIVRRAAERGGR
jgi:hypothetical protein